MSNAEKLVALAKGRFELSDVEKDFFRAVGEGLPFDRRSGDDTIDDPAKSDEWGEDRKLKSELLEWVCTDSKALALVSHKGVTIIGVRFDEEVDLGFARIGFPLVFFDCSFQSRINLQMVTLRLICLRGSHTKEIVGDNMRVEGDVFLDKGFCAEGEVRLPAASIGGTISCRQGKFVNPKGKALNSDRIEVNGSVFLDEGFSAEGEVRFLGATIRSNFECVNSEFNNSEGKALNCDSIEVKGSVFLRNGFKAEGEVCFLGATIGGDFDCLNSEFSNVGGYTLRCDKIKVGGSFNFSEDFKSYGKVCLFGATIGGNLECVNGKFVNPEGKALSCDGIEVKGDVFLRDGFKAEGEIRFLGATVGGDFGCEKSKFKNSVGMALNCDGIEVKGSVFLRDDFKAEGEVCFSRATIGNTLDCENGSFVNRKGSALLCDGIKVKGDVFLRDSFRVEGEVSLVGAMVGRHFIWTGVKSPEKITLDLRSAKVGTLWDDEESWPEEGKLFLHGFVYDEIFDKAVKNAGTRLKWLGLQGEYSPGPYEQLAKVLREGGHEDAAKTVLVAKNEEKAKQKDLTCAERFWYKVLGPMIGYGYRPWWAFYKGPCGVRFVGSILFWILLGCVLFGAGFYHDSEIMMPSKVGAYDGGVVQGNGEVCEGYPTFQFITYSIDAFVPVVDLHQNKYWLANANKGAVWVSNDWFTIRTGGLLLFYLWLHIAMGWVLSTLFVVGLTGMVRK